MSYGFLVLNDTQELLVVDDMLTPWRVGKCSISSYGSWYDGGGGYEIRQVNYSVPGSGLRLLAKTLPTNTGDVWYAGDVAISSGSTMLAYQIRPLSSGATVADQEIYAFVTDASPTPSSGWGIQVFSAAGAVMFDSNRFPLAIKSIATHAAGQTDTTLPTLPSKPAFILPGLGRHSYVGDLHFEVSTLTFMLGGFQRGAGLSSKFISEHSEGVDAYFNGAYTFGSTLTQAIPIINAAIYD